MNTVAEDRRTLPKVLLLVRSLETGGVERQLVLLADELRKRGWDVAVALFYRRGQFLPRLQSAGVPIHDLAKRGRWDVAGFLWRLLRLLRRERPQVLYTWLSGPNVVGALARIPLRMRLVWALAGTRFDPQDYDRVTVLTIALERQLAFLPQRIVPDSFAGGRWAESRGYPGDRITVVRNGIETDRLRTDAAAGSVFRASLGIPPAARVVGMVARLDPQKDHATLVRAAALLASRRPDVRWLIVGDGPETARRAIERAAADAGLTDRIVLAGGTDDVLSAYNACDLTSLSSAYGESSPNVVLESMACGVPCVVTDVGDAAVLVGDCGWVVPPRDPAALAAAWEQALALPSAEREALGRRCRERIEREFSVARMVSDTERVLLGVLAGRGP